MRSLDVVERPNRARDVGSHPRTFVAPLASCFAAAVIIFITGSMIQGPAARQGQHNDFGSSSAPWSVSTSAIHLSTWQLHHAMGSAAYISFTIPMGLGM